MLKDILEAKAAADFDFREAACPADPLRHLFPEWVDYYRTKYAISRVLKPASILEIGVRYGYSALSFLAASPTAHYVGIDNDSGQNGGNPGALEWARSKLSAFSHQLILADSQQLATLPGDFYDLVHIDGQQDGDGTFHDLELGLAKARWLLVDGYFWSRENMLSATYFMEKYQRSIVGAYVIPGYAGDLLIETRTPKGGQRVTTRHHASLQTAYDTDYFLRDCGGFDSFKASNGRELRDQRLRTVFDICAPSPGMDVLDVGCGRGELAYACFRAGARVIGLDYSASAVMIAENVFVDCIGDRLQFVHADVLDYAPSRKFDAILLTDVVEHLSADALDTMFERLRSWLAPHGRLIVHTWPNRLAYEYNHRARRKIVAAAGGYLPRNPRTLYEDKLHINEQTPGRLRRQLRKRFPHVAVALGAEARIVRLAPESLRELVRSAEGIFAIASEEPFATREFEGLNEQHELPRDAARDVSIESIDIPLCMVAATDQLCSVRIANRSPYVLASQDPCPVHISYHWYRGADLVEYDGVRTALLPRLQPGREHVYDVALRAPSEPGSYRVGVALVQEGCFWFDAVSSGAIAFRTVEIEEPPASDARFTP